MIYALLLLIVPHVEHPVDRVDVLEVSHVHDGDGKLQFTQVIAWDWHPHRCRLVVRDWRMVKTPQQRLQFNHGREDAFTLWHDGVQVREVRAPHSRETWTQEDPELVDREYVPKERRRLLSP